jgi:arylsulfatase A-like enzyme
MFSRLRIDLQGVYALAAAILCVSSSLDSDAIAADLASQPNILLILADDLGYSDLGCYGGEIKTPNLDALASRGVRFTQFYNATRCCPSRASLLTGLYPHQAGVGDMTGDAGPQNPGYRGRLTERCVTIPEVLKSAGYRTYMVGKWHLTRNPGPIARGFDEFYGMIGGFNSFFQEQPFYSRLPAGRMQRQYAPGEFYSTDAFADYALDFLADARMTKEQPWFLYLAFNAPHFPLHAPAADVAKYSKTYEQGWDAVREARYAKQQQLGLVDPQWALSPRAIVPANRFNEQTGWANKQNPAWESLPADRRADLARRMAVYAAMIDRMDHAIGRVVASLREHGEIDNTLVLFLSDNGACAEWDPWGFDGVSGPNNKLHTGDELAKMGGPGTYHSYGSGWANACNTPWRLYKHYGHEGGISTPLIVRWPRGIADRLAGQLVQQPGHLIDLMPTIAAAAGAKYPARHAGSDVLPAEGQSLLPALQGAAPHARKIYWEHHGNRAVRDGRWKLVGLEGSPTWELYDIDADRVESRDLSRQEPETVRRLIEQWNAWADQCFVRKQAR